MQNAINFLRALPMGWLIIPIIVPIVSMVVCCVVNFLLARLVMEISVRVLYLVCAGDQNDALEYITPISTLIVLLETLVWLFLAWISLTLAGPAAAAIYIVGTLAFFCWWGEQEKAKESK